MNQSNISKNSIHVNDGVAVYVHSTHNMCLEVKETGNQVTLPPLNSM